MAGDLVMETLVYELISVINENSLLRNNSGQSIVTRIKAHFSFELTEKELDYSLSVLFRSENSLLQFISNGCCDKTLKGGIKDSLSLIIELLKKYTKYLVQYLVPIKDVCFEVVKRTCGPEVLKNAYEVLKVVINSKESLSIKDDLQIPNIVTFLHSRCLTDKSIKPLALQGVYELYGAIARNFPEFCNENRCNSLVRHILHELQKQMRHTNNVKPCVIEGCMNALKGVMTHSTRGHDDENPAESEEIYKYVRDACAFQEEASKRVYQRAALDLFATHTAQLFGWVIEHKDVQFWLHNLSTWAARPSSEDKYAGIKTMKAFHAQAIEYLKTHPEDPIKTSLMGYYKTVLDNRSAHHYDMDLAIEGISTIAGLSGDVVNQEDISFVFRVILQRAQSDSPTEGKTEQSDEHLAKYLECLSNICTKLRSVSNEQLSAITRLWRSVVERYPYHYPRAQFNIVRSLNITMLKMGMCDASVFDSFLYPVVYQSIIVTCSHTLVEEAELQEELTGKEVKTYKNYQELWKGLFQVGYENNKINDKVPGASKELRRSIMDNLYNCFIKSLIVIVDKLNVGYKRDDSTEVVRSDPESSLKGEVPEDHSVLCNLANLYRDILPSLVAKKLSKWLAELITTVVNQSARFPLVSAFYKLLAAVLSVAERADYFSDESEETRSLGHYVMRYLEDVMFHCHQYKNDLQASCLLAIISLPIPLIEPLLAGLARIMQMIFQLGGSVLSLAHSGMDSLELWLRKLPTDRVRPVLQLVLPTFDPYLRSRGITTELPDDEGVPLSKRQQQRERRVQEATQLLRLQRRMLRLLSRLDSATCLGLLKPPGDTTAWSAEATVTLKLPFPDQRFPVHFDSLLPRVVELALTSSDRQTKAAACEVLHTFVIIFIGSSGTLRSTREPELVKVLTRLAPALLRLSCGSDLVARQLFHPLTLQLMHWFSSPEMLVTSKDQQAVQTQTVLQAVWDGITDEEDTALQDFSALCLQEFVVWAIRQSTVDQMAKSPVGPKAIVRQLNMYCLHPSLSKRRGAALAFCHIAKTLREEVSLVDQFWLELLYHLVCNLELGECHDHPATAALADRGHVLRVVEKNADLFNKASAARRVPPALGSGLLIDVVKFLLRKCASKTAICATKCRGLLMKIMPLVPDLPSPDQLVDMVQVCEGAGNGSVLPFQPSPADAEHLRASIDAYSWAIKMGFISPAVALKGQSRLVACVEYFINLIDLTVVPTVYCSRRDSVLTKAKCDMVVALFDLLAVVAEHIKLLPYTFFRDKFWKLLAMCVLSPHNVGFDWRNRELSESLNDKLRLQLCTLRDNLDRSTLTDMYNALSNQVLYDCSACVERLSHLCQGLRNLELKDKQHVAGLITLHKTDLLRHVKHGLTWDGNALVNGVFLSLFDSEGLPLHPESAVKAFADQLLHLAVQLGANVRTTLYCVMNRREVSSTTKGKHFLKLFEDQVIAHLLQDPDLSVSRLVDPPSATNLEIIHQMLIASKYTKNKFNRSAEALLSSVTAKWSPLSAWAGDAQSRSWLVTLLQGLVQLPPPARAVGALAAAPAASAWLLGQLSNPGVKLEYKAELVELLPSVVGETNTAQLEEALSQLQARFPVSTTEELRPGTAERAAFVSVYSALLRALGATGSSSVLRVVCESAAESEHVCGDARRDALANMMTSHTDEVQLRALKMVYDKFQDETRDIDFRLGLMSRFLIVMLHHASKTAVTQFYTDRIQNVVNTLEERLMRSHDPEWRSKQQLVSKIGACQLITPLFLRLDKEELDKKENPVASAASHSIPEGDRLAQYLGKKFLRIRELACSREELQELFRRFQCAAYNALSLFLCNIGKEEKFFPTFVFKEDPQKPLWRKIIPIEPKFTFPIDFNDYPKIKKQLVQMRSKVPAGEGANQKPTIYLPSQSLFNSSLQEDITAFDFSMYNVRDADRMHQVLTVEDEAPSAVSLELEEDCLNNHECMGTLMAIVDYLCNKSPVNVAKGERTQLPKWMEHLRESLTAEGQPENCRAFIVKLILNCEHHFKPFARYWTSPIIQCVLDNCFGDTFNSMIHDIICMFYNWRAVEIPYSTEDKLKASELLRLLVLRTPSERVDVLKYNVEVIRCLVIMWKGMLSVPYQELLDLVRPPPPGTVTGASTADPGVLLADAFLAQNILPFNRTGKSHYFEHLLAHLQRPDSKIYKSCATVVGKILRILSEENGLQGEDLEFFNRVVDVICPKENNRRGRNDQRFIFCLHNIRDNYPAIVKGFEAQCISMLDLPASFSVMLVEILTTALEFDDFRRDAFSMLTDLPRFLQDESNPDRQVATLKLVNRLIPHLTPTQTSELLPNVTALSNHKQAKARAVVYDIVAWIYDQYSQLRNDEDAAARVAKSEAVEVAKAVLISGLADPDKKLKDERYSFWSGNGRLSSQGWGRLKDVLQTLYSPSCEASFLTAATTLLLDLCQQADEYRRDIFDTPLHPCKFEKYEVSGSFRTQHAAFVPMFANTLASQISSLSLGSFTDFNFQLRATQSPSSLYSATLQSSLSMADAPDQSLYSFAGPSTSKASFVQTSFGHKYKQGPGFGTDYLEANDTTDGGPEASDSPVLRKRRLIRDKQKVSRSFAEHNRQKGAQQRREKAERQRRREGEVTLTRGYRKGDLPDVQIPCSDVVTALTTLAKRDQLMARQLLVAVYKALVANNVSSDVPGVSVALDCILRNTTSHEPPLMAAVMEMGLVRPEECVTPAQVITQVSKNSHQMSVGALLAEARLMVGEAPPPTHKRGRHKRGSVGHDDWVYLAEIYHSLEEKDVVQGLFEDKIAEACSATVQEALQAEDRARWKLAHTKYAECLNSQSGTAAENFLYEASFKCSAHLSKWEDLNKTLKENLLENNLDEVWNDEWNRDHLLPWLFLSEVHCTQKTTVPAVAADFNTALNEWLKDKDRKKHIESKLSEMLSVLLVVRGDGAWAKLISETSVNQFLAVWQQLDSLNGHLRGSRLLTVHKLMDTYRFLELPPSSDASWCEEVNQLLKKEWLKHSPSKTDNLISWETQAVYRNIFAKKLEVDGRKNFAPFKLDNYSKTLECALKQKNFYVAKKYIDKIKTERNAKLDSLLLSNSKFRLLRAQLEDNHSPRKVDEILKVWGPLVNLKEQAQQGSLEYPLNRELHIHTAEFYRTLLDVVKGQPSILDNQSDATMEKLAQLDLGDEDIPSGLKHKVVCSLEQAVAVSKDKSTSETNHLADAYLRLATFCHEIDDPQYRNRLIQSLLRAMKYGSTEARVLFPSLLEPSLAHHTDLFVSESAQVPEWMFLSWVAQLLAHLDTEVGVAVAPLLLSLARQYPTALQFPFHLSREMYRYRHPATEATVTELSGILKMDATTTDLLRSLSCVCQPYTCLQYHLEHLRSVIVQGLGNDAFFEAYNTMKREAFPPENNDKIKGEAFNCSKKFTDEVENAYYQLGNNEISMSDFVKKLEVLINQLKFQKNVEKIKEEKMKDNNETKTIESIQKHIELSYFSPWLISGYNGDVEIPGQYTGESKPLPKHHVTIARFKRHVMHLGSLRAPIKITVLGSDARDHPFLVKFGEDLRQDQRIQQMFELINQLLSADATASRRQLSLQTFSVVPLNTRLGIIQWVENTTTLRDFIAINDDEIKKKMSPKHAIYHTEHFYRCDHTNPIALSKFFKFVKKEDSIQKYLSAVNDFPTYQLRNAVLKLSTSPEVFVHLRYVMLTNHACLSICQWLLGIGDRHLDNTLVCLDSGRLLGIDFGHAFGTATQMLIVPELMPFRLTPQILNLAAPLYSTGLIKETMVHSLRVLRDNSRLLVATMTVFILEPSVDWVKAARRHEAYSESVEGNVDWFPQLKISLARQKLEGLHPRKAMEEDLRMGHEAKPHYGKLRELLWDEGDSPQLRDVPRDGLSPRQQVECLIAHATNRHILSKTYSGWGSWV